jgi:poly-beta-1,6-N-acetyl-D-glucosamine synthase
MVLLTFAFLSLHIMLLIVLLAGLQRIASKGVPKEGQFHSLTVIVPFRNESGNLPSLVECLSRQTYPSFEVLLVDDHSTDASHSIAMELCKGDDRFRVIQQAGNGKKEAITEGIRVGTGEIIVTTDADCTFGETWLYEINKPFSDDRIKLVFGPVHLRSDGSFFGGLQEMEFAAVLGTGMALFGIGLPIYCNGANLAYRKESYLRVSGFAGNSHIVSGDDQFMLEKTRDNFKDGIFLLNSIDGLVATRPLRTLSEFFHQRLRWASKWNTGTGLTSKVVALFILIVQFFFLVSWWLIIAGYGNKELIFLVGAKMLLEFILISSILSSANVRTSYLKFLILQFAYPFYVLIVGVCSNFKAFEWKGRRHSTA